MIYLDYAAATPVDDAVLAAANPFFAEAFYNPSARYQVAKQVRHALDASRGIVASWLGCRAEEIFFTAGGTEANNLAVAGVMQKYPGKNCIISALEHDSVYEPAQQYEVRIAPANKHGITDVVKLEELIDDDTVLVSIIYANSEIGTIQPLRKISNMLRKIRNDRRSAGSDVPLYFHTDACQAANYLDLHANTLGVDMMTLNGGKIYGFKQSGCLFVNRHVQLEPLIRGGGQERTLRSGTESVVHAVGLSAALDKTQKMHAEEVKRMQRLQKLFISQLADEVPDAVVNGTLKHRLPNNVHITLPGCQNEILLLKLEEQGILAAAGSACSANDLKKPSRVMEAIGKSNADAQASIRFSMGRGTTEEAIKSTIHSLSQLVSKNQ